MPATTTMRPHIVSLSGGSASAVAADRVINRYGSNAVDLWFADTLWEDDDLYRFLEDLEKRWDKKIIRHTDGRTPLQVAEDKKLIPNSWAAPCSFELKQKPFREYLLLQEKPVTVHLGLDWSETHRHAKPKEIYEQIEGVEVDFPLMWEPIPWRGYTLLIQEWGIKIPRLYELGMPHNNCGGRCVRQGKGEWLRLHKYLPERYEEVSQWEESQRKLGGPRANRTIVRDRADGDSTPLTLAELREQNTTSQLELFTTVDDNYGCFCDEYLTDGESE